jgi:hypothetical protein
MQKISPNYTIAQLPNDLDLFFLRWQIGCGAAIFLQFVVQSLQADA